MKAMQNEIQTRSFLDLIESDKVVIPKIQRDYAQGRNDIKSSEVRAGFLTSIFEAITNGDKPLLLNFIYGSKEDGVFTPLDGQQRLTTLFLLHWYFVPKNESMILSYKDKRGNNYYSRFSYETRISSKDFCDALINQSAEDLKKKLDKKLVAHPNKVLTLSNIIKDESWFKWDWQKDPTVKGMLVMLDEIDKRANILNEKSRENIWDKLKEGIIAFDLLPLDKFNLSDELYVKMNARGKELDSFDIFKSTMEEQLRKFSHDDTINTWMRSVDNKWLDIFWKKLISSGVELDDTNVNEVESSYLRFFKRMIVYYLFTNDDCINENFLDDFNKQNIPFEYEDNDLLNKLREYSVRHDTLDILNTLITVGFFKEEFFKFIIEFFESFIPNEKNKDTGADFIHKIRFENEKNLFESFIDESIDYETRVQFYALVQFLKYNPARDIQNDSKLNDELNSWMRIIRNLSTFTNTYYYNTYSDFHNSLINIRLWARSIYSEKQTSSILEYIKDKDLRGFNIEQLEEEKIKAGLLDTSHWGELIYKAEEHPYFRGQIRFLLEWSRINNEYDINSFEKYKTIVFSIFKEDGIKEEYSQDYLLRNAIMLSDNWMQDKLLISDTNKSRDKSWKRYLREFRYSQNLKYLLDLFMKEPDNDFKNFLLNYIDANTPTDWRKYFMEYPEMHKAMYNHNIDAWNWDTEEIALISKTRWSSRHKELKTYYLSFKYPGSYYFDSHDEIPSPFTVRLHNTQGEEIHVKSMSNSNGNTYNIIMFSKPNIDGFEEIGNNVWEKVYSVKDFDQLEETIKQLI